MTGRVPQLIRDLSKHQFFKEFVNFQTKRGQDKNTAAKLLLIEFNGKLVETKKAHLDALVDEGVKAETDDVGTAAKRVRAKLDELTGIFNRKDELLKSEGQIPIYYWLARSIGESEKPLVREFLVDFNTRLSQVKSASRRGETLPRSDEDLQQYELWSRSTNDERSLKGRFGVLLRRFEEFAATKIKGQIEKMVEWFQEHYKDPSDGVPHDSKEGGYIYTNGGPFDAHDILHDEFPEASESVIEDAVRLINREGGPEWVRMEDY